MDFKLNPTQAIVMWDNATNVLPHPVIQCVMSYVKTNTFLAAWELTKAAQGSILLSGFWVLQKWGNFLSNVPRQPHNLFHVLWLDDPDNYLSLTEKIIHKVCQNHNNQKHCLSMHIIILTQCLLVIVFFFPSKHPRVCFAF